MAAVEAAPARRVSIGRATAVTALLTASGTSLGFVRDLVMAHQFGASGGTDAFLVGWTIPETVSSLLIEDAMALAVVPAVSLALHRRGHARAFVASALPRLAAVLAVAALLSALAAPVLVGMLAPGIGRPDDAVRCVRLTSLTILTFGVVGFMSATLRAHHRFGPPACIYAAYNTGILTMIAVFHEPLGVTSAALGVAFGSLLMIAVQAPVFARCLAPAHVPHRAALEGEAGRAAALGLAAIAPIVLWSLLRQGQVLVERFLGSSLSEGSISHLNYAERVAQAPVMLSLLLVAVTFPRLARATAAGDLTMVRRRMECDIVAVGGMVLCATAFVVAFAPTIITVLFEHGRFTGGDTQSTASIMRIYAVGLLAQAMVAVAGRGFFARGTPSWYPVSCVALGLGATAAIGVATVKGFGVGGLAAANAAGVSVSATLLLVGLRKRLAAISLRHVAHDLLTLAMAAAVATAIGLLVHAGLADKAPPALVLPIGGIAVLAVYGTTLMMACACRGLTKARHAATAAGQDASPLELFCPLVIRSASRVISRFDRGKTSDPDTADAQSARQGAVGTDVPLGGAHQ